MKLLVERGATSQILHVAIKDSASTAGALLAGLAYNSAGLVCRYIRPGEALSGAITLEDITTIGTYAAPTSASHIRFKAVDGTNFPGIYELHLHNDWVNATGTRRGLVVMLRGAANMVPLPLEIQLTGANLNDSARAGLTALPTAASGAAGGLPTVDANNKVVGVQIDGIDAAALKADAVSEIQSGLAVESGGNLATLIARLTAARAGYLDNLNVGGLVASSAEATAIQNNTRAVRVVPAAMERPDSGSTVYRIELLLYDAVGNMEAPDSAPTISVVDESGNSRDVNLDSTTMTLVAAGRYRSEYTVASGHDIEQLVFAFSVVEGGLTRVYGNASLVVDTTAVDFTASDRSDLAAIKAKTDQIAFTAGDVKATLDGETVVLSDGSLTAAKFAAGALSAAALASAACSKIADILFRRRMSDVFSSSDGDAPHLSSLYGDIQARQRANTTANPGNLTVLNPGGTTLGLIPLTEGDPSDAPITGTALVP